MFCAVVFCMAVVLRVLFPQQGAAVCGWCCSGCVVCVCVCVGGGGSMGAGVGG